MPSLQYSSLDLRRRERFVLSLFFFFPKLHFHISLFFLRDVTHLHFPARPDQNLLIESKRNQLIVVTLSSPSPPFEFSAYSGAIDYM